MAIRSKNAHYHFHTIQARHWKQLAMKNGGQVVWEDMGAFVESVDDALAEVEDELPKDFPGKTWEAVSTGMRGEVKRFLFEAEALTRA